jgi:small subunit ribosomal protein S9
MAETTTKKTKTPKKSKKVKKDYIYALGRRKQATARIRFYTKEKGDIEVNGKRAEEYFPGEVNQFLYSEPLKTCNLLGKNKITVKVSGSGKHGQLEAVIHGISRALVILDEEKYRPILKKRGFMKRDPRAKERRKAGKGGKARASKQSPKR